MFPAKFDYYRAGSVQEAISLLQQHDDAKVLAGGHSLIPAMKLRLSHPHALIDIGRIDDLKSISRDNGRVTIGALNTHATLASSDLLKEQCPLMAEAASHIGDPQVRNKGTIGGNLAHADPASDLPAVVLALNGTLHLAGPEGERQVDAGDFFVDLLTTDLKEDEILTAIEVDALGSNTGSAYLKFEHPASGYAICGAAAVMSLSDDGSVTNARLCFNGVTGTPHDARNVHELLSGVKEDESLIARIKDSVTDFIFGKTPSDQAIEFISKHFLDIKEPMGDIHASGEYRTELASVYGARALKLARDRAQG